MDRASQKASKLGPYAQAELACRSNWKEHRRPLSKLRIHQSVPHKFTHCRVPWGSNFYLYSPNRNLLDELIGGELLGSGIQGCNDRDIRLAFIVHRNSDAQNSSFTIYLRLYNDHLRG